MDYFHLNVDREQLLSMSSLGLAHLGDGVFEVMVRSWIALHGKAKPKDLHRATVTYVSAPAQAAAMEKAAAPSSARRRPTSYRGAGMTPPTRCPSGLRRAQYQAATGLEALFGWLYLQGPHPAAQRAV